MTAEGPAHQADLSPKLGPAPGRKIAVIEGPNMSNLGNRDPAVFGTLTSLSELHDRLQGVATRLSLIVEFFVSNFEGEILEYIHGLPQRVDGVLVNPAGLTVVGEATRHALEDTRLPVIEVHFANLAQRGLASRFTRTSMGVAMGMGQFSYDAALVGLAGVLDCTEP